MPLPQPSPPLATAAGAAGGGGRRRRQVRVHVVQAWQSGHLVRGGCREGSMVRVHLTRPCTGAGLGSCGRGAAPAAQKCNFREMYM